VTSLVPESYQVNNISRCDKVQQPKVVVVALKLPASIKGSYLYRFASFVSVLALVHKYVSEVLIQTNGYAKLSYTSYHIVSTGYQRLVSATARQLVQLPVQCSLSSTIVSFVHTLINYPLASTVSFKLPVQYGNQLCQPLPVKIQRRELGCS
jgi:hypothetical protein